MHILVSLFKPGKAFEHRPDKQTGDHCRRGPGHPGGGQVVEVNTPHQTEVSCGTVVGGAHHLAWVIRTARLWYCSHCRAEFTSHSIDQMLLHLDTAGVPYPTL